MYVNIPFDFLLFGEPILFLNLLAFFASDRYYQPCMLCLAWYRYVHEGYSKTLARPHLVLALSSTKAQTQRPRGCQFWSCLSRKNTTSLLASFQSPNVNLFHPCASLGCTLTFFAE
ncbi:MAG TPA: hypothetical protein DCE42_01950 [Myxococcales bacterium]|nr:hypothetical protein [Deltaproteobacteria bacterium]MBU51703.1 hypothetical protein [Deltaproteobacteria bacterium]HAA53486.1 hypothetical protein [Myxococcales bacterium]